MCRNARDFVAAVFATAMVGADVALENTEFPSDALADALSAHRVTTMFCDNEFAEQVRDADPSIQVIDPAETQPPRAPPRPKVAPSGRIVLLTSGTTGIPRVRRAHPGSAPDWGPA
ncbi:AMP-binding protein [Mycobacterium tilburgii]|uniref:AMP-binding protein n=1 Tax=Mycobacterium tilburgii TaxID=44467 RepID=UPI0021B28250|nr:AMP-binding protein [Mycobacterium tilburgii]